MRQRTTRRGFLGTSLLGGAGAALCFPHLGIAGQSAEEGKGLCVTICSHWSYTGVGWDMGIESSVLSVTDAMEIADRPPYVKTCIDLDGRAYELLAEKFPEVAKRLAKYLGDGKVELIGGAYGQPLGTMFSGESNIRQIVYGRETIRKALGYEVVTFLEEEEFTHPQIPQIIAGAGFRYASLAQLDTWGNAGIPRLELNTFNWKGLDGTTIPCIPKNSIFGGEQLSPDPKQLVSSNVFKRLEALGKPLFLAWTEFGWETPELPAYLKIPDMYKKFVDDSPLPVEFVTLKNYLDKYGSQPRETIFLNMDAWTKLLTWGLGGDQLRIMDRKVEALLHAAERFDAIASTLGARSKAQRLDKAWKDLLASQSHDVALCEYSRWQAFLPPLDRLEDYHNRTWGSIGYNHLDAAQKEGQEILDSSVRHIVEQIDSQTGAQDSWAVTVFNPSAWERTHLVTTGRVYPTPGKARDLVVKDNSGRVVPSQIIKADKDNQGNLIFANVTFRAEKVPSVGYDTYYVEYTPTATQASGTDLQINETHLELENKFVQVRLNPTNGAVTSLIDKQTGREMLDAQRSPFPIFRGTPNQSYPLYGDGRGGKIPPVFDSSKSMVPPTQKAQDQAWAGQGDGGGLSLSVIRWIEKGPLRATVKTRHHWPLLEFETYVTLCAGVPWVEVTSHVLARVPPAPDAPEANNRLPIEIKNGYWLTFAPSFQPTSIIRDFPFGVEPTEHQAFHALTFVDWVGKDAGLLVLHAGSQYFRRESDGTLSNLLMREWESFYTSEYGWPRYSEFRHALMPHRAGLTHAQLHRAASEFAQELITVVGHPRKGSLPKRKGFITVRPDGVQLSAFRKKNGRGFEFRVVEVEGQEAAASAELAIPIAGAVETNLLGKKLAEVSLKGNKLGFKIQPWKIRTFEVT